MIDVRAVVRAWVVRARTLDLPRVLGRGSVWALGLALAVATTYVGRLSGPFVFDDQQAILDNPTLRALGPGVLDPPRETPVAARPLVNLSLALDYALHGPSPTAF
ncbi:MAG: hypothetical protein ABW321_27105, partial [Polyangiales bacterium]